MYLVVSFYKKIQILAGGYIKGISEFIVIFLFYEYVLSLFLVQQDDCHLFIFFSI